MSAAKFVVATDTEVYEQGEEYAFPQLSGRPSARLESWEPDGDYVVLHFEGGVTRCMPEGRVRFIDVVDG